MGRGRTPSRSVRYSARDACVTPGRRELADRLRGIIEGKATGPPVFLPLFHAIASQIKAEPPHGFLLSATKLAAGLTSLHHTLNAECLFVSCAGLIETESLGARLDWATYPPRLVGSDLVPSEVQGPVDQALQSARVVAAVDACQRLNKTLPSGAAIGAGLTGPMRLAAELFPSLAQFKRAPYQGDIDGALDASGQVSLAFAKLFLEAGASVIVLLERITELDRDLRKMVVWADAMAPIINLAEFHRVPIILLLLSPPGFVVPFEFSDVIARCICVGDDQLFCRDLSGRRSTAIKLLVEPSTTLLQTCLVTTHGEVPVDANIGRLSEWTKAWRAAIDDWHLDRGAELDSATKL